MAAVSSTPISFPAYKKFIKNQNLSYEELSRKYFVMNDLVNQEMKRDFVNRGVVKFLSKRAKFLADEAMSALLKREIA